MKSDKKPTPKAETRQVKIPRTAGSMRFTKCGTFRGFKYD